MPMNVEVITSYINGKRYKKALPKQHDFRQYAPHIVKNENPEYKREMICTLTSRRLAQEPTAIKLHMEGSMYKKALKKWEECQKTGENYVPKPGKEIIEIKQQPTYESSRSALGGKWIKKDEKEEEIYLIKKAIQKTTKKLMKHVKIPQQPMNNDSDVDDDDSTYGDVEVVPEDIPKVNGTATNSASDLEENDDNDAEEEGDNEEEEDDEQENEEDDEEDEDDDEEAEEVEDDDEEAEEVEDDDEEVEEEPIIQPPPTKKSRGVKQTKPVVPTRSSTRLRKTKKVQG